MTEYDKRSVPEGEDKESCNLPTSRGFPIIIVQRSLQLSFFDPPKKSSCPIKATLEIFEKSNFAKMVLECSYSLQDAILTI